MTFLDLPAALAFIALTLPVGSLLILAVTLLFIPDLVERRVHQIVGGGLAGGLLATLGLSVSLMLGAPDIAVDLGSVIAIRGFHIDIAFLLDGPAAMFLTLDFLLCGLIGMFSARYLHREVGFRRFYLLLMVFAVGISLVASARGLDLLFAGWELVGLSSALLIAFFHRRPSPVAHGLRAYSVYRVTDIGLLLGVVLVHHLPGSGIGILDGSATVTPGPLPWMVGALLIFGAMGKGASVPFTGWLPRAMEGPTPSSAIFYGALSIHASPFLLLRIQPILDTHPALRAAVIVIGLVTAAHASMVGRVQSDIKSTLGYASVAQVGIIWVWAGLGWETVGVVHIAGHAALRTWQLLRAPNLLHDRREVQALLGQGVQQSYAEQYLPEWMRARLYTIALERWYLDELVFHGAASLLFRPLAAIDHLDDTVGNLLDSTESTESTSAVRQPAEVLSR